MKKLLLPDEHCHANYTGPQKIEAHHKVFLLYRKR
jgi:hypothetical protein